MDIDTLIQKSYNRSPGEQREAKLKVFEIEALNSVARNIKEASNSSSYLAKKVFWLNIILNFATIALAVIAYWEYTKP